MGGKNGIVLPALLTELSFFSMGHIGGPTIGWFMFNGSVHSNTSGTCGDLLWTAVEGLECPNPLTKCMCLWENHLKWWEFSKKNIGDIPFFWGNIISSHCFWEVPRCSWNFHKRFSLPPSWQATFEGCGSAEKMGPDYFGRQFTCLTSTGSPNRNWFMFVAQL